MLLYIIPEIVCNYCKNDLETNGDYIIDDMKSHRGVQIRVSNIIVQEADPKEKTSNYIKKFHETLFKKMCPKSHVQKQEFLNTLNGKNINQQAYLCKKRNTRN